MPFCWPTSHLKGQNVAHIIGFMLIIPYFCSKKRNMDTMQFGSLYRKAMGSTLGTFVQSVLLAYVVYMLCRLAFVAENWTLYRQAFADGNLWLMLQGSLLFDTSAILYTLAPYALLMLPPWPWKERIGWQQAARWVFVVVNSLAIVLNLCDAVYVQYTGRRTTTTIFTEFSNEGNLATILSTELLHHWYLVLFGLALIWMMMKMTAKPQNPKTEKPKNRKTEKPKNRTPWYALHTAAFVLYLPLMLAGMRGGFTTAVRPITVSNAIQYVAHPTDAPIVLNTPFSLIRTLGKTSFPIPHYLTDDELHRLYSPVHPAASPTAADTLPMDKRNVVVLIVESLGREFIGAYNQAGADGMCSLDQGHYRGYTPFIDSLYPHCLSFDYTFANGRKSIDAMPSILSSIPMFIEPFVLTPASMNKVSGLAGELGRVGYSSAFFHGAENSSMGFQAFARSTGFQAYYGRDEFNQDGRFRGDADFDGTWAIWDEPFLQFFALKMTEMKQPFVTALFTASSHHPFAVPQALSQRFPEEGSNPLHKCIRYTDHALRRFFETASRQPWYPNTLFVLTGDHTNQPDHPEYQTDLGLFGSPILLYDPSGQLISPGRRHCIAQQIDIMPTLLGLLHYPHSYVAFGTDLSHTPDARTWAISYHGGLYQLVQDGYVLQFDGQHTTALYHYPSDWMLRHNLLHRLPSVQHRMERMAKAIIQSYMTRMNRDQLTVQ